MRSNVWARFLLRRLLGLVGVLFALVAGVFWLLQLIPGDAVLLSLGADAPKAEIEQVKHQNGFDLPVWHQFTRYLDQVLLHGNFGRSFISDEPVSQLIRERIGQSAFLAGVALAVILVFGLAIGMLAAAVTKEGRHPKFEVAFVSITSAVGSIPELLTATVLAFAFAVELRIFPVAGQGGFKYLVLPVVALAFAPVMALCRIVRLETLNVLSQDYIRTARGKRLSSAEIYLKHVLPNVFTAMLTVSGLVFSTLVGGAVIIENIFSRAGIGTALVAAVNQKDTVVVQGLILVLGTVLVVVNMIVDLILAVVDRTSLARSA